MRLYESMRTATRCALATSLRVDRACETDMLEEGGEEAAVRDGRVELSFRPFEIKTLRFSLAR